MYRERGYAEQAAQNRIRTDGAHRACDPRISGRIHRDRLSRLCAAVYLRHVRGYAGGAAYVGAEDAFSEKLPLRQPVLCGRNPSAVGPVLRPHGQHEPRHGLGDTMHVGLSAAVDGLDAARLCAAERSPRGGAADVSGLNLRPLHRFPRGRAAALFCHVQLLCLLPDLLLRRAGRLCEGTSDKGTAPSGTRLFAVPLLLHRHAEPSADLCADPAAACL